LPALASIALLSGCTVGPKYTRPVVSAPSAWKEEPPFRAAAPKDTLPKGTWWSLFEDAELNALEDEALKANQTLEAARNQLGAARASARITQSGLYPTFNVTPSAQRSRLSGNRPTNGSLLLFSPVTQNNFTIPFNLNYEADIFGGVRRSVEAANARYQSSAASLENVRLVVASELAADYFQLRGLDAEIAVVDSSVQLQQRGLQLVENRHNGGLASGLDVAQQRAVLDATKTQAELLHQQRSQFEHAIAVLVGTSASTFSLAAKPLALAPPAVPIGVPSDVLERRPDIAAAERLVAAQNADIGIAESALYPSINLFGGGGVQSSTITRVFNAPSFVWSLGAAAAQPIFSGGKLRAQVDLEKSLYGASVADYRQTVLTAFQEVEDGISGLSVLDRAAQSQQLAVEDSQNALRIANDRYVGGLVTYLDVINAQEQLLTNQRLATQILSQRLLTSVFLVKALGGGWDARSLQAVGVKPSLKDMATP
jgi:NodT family efflux transporter outer membrane factor (OMF) lipoprotein